MSKRALWTALMVTLLGTGCVSTPTGDSLYEDLGGRPGIDRIAGRFVAGVGANPDIRPFFMNTDLERFHKLFGEHLCEVAGGPCEYSGDDMVQTHIGMNIDEAQFNYVVEILINAMRAEDVPYGVQNRLLARLAPMREDIINR